MNPRRLIIILYVIVLAAFAIGGGAVLLDARAQYRQLKQVEAIDRQRLVQAQQRLHEQEVILQRLKSDPAFVERAIRERLKYAKPGEEIYRFDRD